MEDKAGLPAGRQVEFRVGSEVLRGSLFAPKGKGPFPGVVFFHGRGSSRARYLPIAKKITEKGIIALAFDFGGCGESDGDFEKQTQRKGIADGDAALKFLLEQNVDKNRIGIQGTSFGGFVAGMLLNNYNFIKSIVLRAPAAYADKLLGTHISSVGPVFYNKKENWFNSSAYKGMGKFKGDLLVIQSEKDEIVSSPVVKKYYSEAKQAKKRKLVVQKNAPHLLQDDPKSLEEFYKLTVNWFLETL